MDKIIASIPPLLEEKIQMFTNKQTDFLSEYTTIRSLNSSEEIQNYVNEVIKEIAHLKEKKNKMDKDGINKFR